VFPCTCGNPLLRVVAKTTGTYYGKAMTAGHIYTVADGGTGSGLDGLGDGGRWARRLSAWLGGRRAGYLAGRGERAEQRERPGGFGAWLGVIDHQ